MGVVHSLCRSSFLPGEGVIYYHNQVKDTTHTQIENNIVPSTSSSSVSYDPMLLKVITSGSTRLEVIERMVDALRHSHVYGVPTNMQLLLNALQLQSFREKGADSQTLVDHEAELTQTVPPKPFEVANSIAAYLFASGASNDTNPWKKLTGFCNSHALTRILHMKVNGTTIPCKVAGDSAMENAYSVSLPSGEVFTVQLVKSLENQLQIQVNNRLVSSFVYREGEGVKVFPMTTLDCFPSERSPFS